MHLSASSLLSLFFIPAVLCAPPSSSRSRNGNSADAAQGATPGSTVYDGMTVPPITELTESSFNETLSKGYWIVDAFSPYCPHCLSLAPKLQTVYERYYTSNPTSSSQRSSGSSTSFTDYYDFRFAKLDCIAFGTTCSEKMNVRTFPTLAIFHNGQEIRRTTGDRSIEELVEFVETALETIKPGSRPADEHSPDNSASRNPETSTSNTKSESRPQLRTGTTVSSGEAVQKPFRERDEKELKADTQRAFKKYPSSPKPPTVVGTGPNPKGVSVELDALDFQDRVTKTLDSWWIKFYAPWCPHCKAMQSSWAAMARDMKGKLNIGEVNCDVEKRLCRDVRANSYPTIMFFRGPDHFQYEGLRGAGDLLKYAENAAAAITPVPEVDAAEFEQLETTNDVLFLYFWDDATTSEDLEALERIPLHMMNKQAKVVKTTDTKLAKRFRIATWPQLIVSRDGKPSYYPGLAPQHMRDINRLVDWMNKVGLPLVPEISTLNAREIMDRKYVVMGILNRERSDEFEIARKELKNSAMEWMDKQQQAFVLERQELRDAKQLRIEEAEDRKDQRALRDAKMIRINMDDIQRKGVAFAWLDGVFWERWIRTTFGIGSGDGDRVIIYDQENRRYWDTTITGNPIVPSRTSILETLPKVVASPPKISPKIVGSSLSHLMFRIRTTVGDHPWLSTIVFIAMFVLLLGFRRSFKRLRRHNIGAAAGVFLLGEKDSHVGSQPNGKVD